MGLWVLAPLALFIALLLWDREHLFTLEKGLAVLNLVLATPWLLGMGLRAEIFPEWAFRAGWYLAIPEAVLGAVGTGLLFSRMGIGVGRRPARSGGGSSQAAGAGGRASEVYKLSASDRLLAAAPWVLGYGIALMLVMFWTRNRI